SCLSSSSEKRPTTPCSPSALEASRPSTSSPTRSVNAGSTSATSLSRRAARCASFRKEGPAHETISPPFRLRGAIAGAACRHAVQHSGGDGLHLYFHGDHGWGSHSQEAAPVGAPVEPAVRCGLLLRRSRSGLRPRGSDPGVPRAPGGAHL